MCVCVSLSLHTSTHTRTYTDMDLDILSLTRTLSLFRVRSFSACAKAATLLVSCFNSSVLWSGTLQVVFPPPPHLLPSPRLEATLYHLSWPCFCFLSSALLFPFTVSASYFCFALLCFASLYLCISVSFSLTLPSSPLRTIRHARIRVAPTSLCGSFRFFFIFLLRLKAIEAFFS